jgi:cell wall-associated NlpC family hydrolase
VNAFVQGSTRAHGAPILPTGTPASEVTVVSHRSRIRSFALSLAVLAALPAAAHGSTGGASPGGAAAPAATVRDSGGAAPGAVVKRHRRHRTRRQRVPAAATVSPSASATLLADGTASPPAGAPAEVAAVIVAGNRIASLPYRWGGGHASWEDTGYDCSGSVGYALHGGGLLDASATSGDLMSYGERGPGTWITLYANADHVYMVVAGLRFDTSGARPSRWQLAPRSAAGFAVRHPAGF